MGRSCAAGRGGEGGEDGDWSPPPAGCLTGVAISLLNWEPAPSSGEVEMGVTHHRDITTSRGSTLHIGYALTLIFRQIK